MKRFLWFHVVWLFLVSPGVAGDLEIVAPTETLKPGQHYLLGVKGLTSEDLPTAQIICEPKESATAIGVTGWAGEQYLWFIAQKEGRHFVVVCIVRNGKAVVASCTVQVGKGNPPPPPVPVPVPGDLAIVVVEETKNRTAQQAIVLLGLRKYCGSKKVWYRIADPDQRDAVTGQVPKWLGVANAKIAENNIPLPVVVVGSVANEVFSAVATEAVPDTVVAAVEIIKNYQQDEKTSLFVPTPMTVVKAMLKEARVTKADVVYDLGSGDGRIPILAAKMYGCRAVGYEIDPKLVMESQKNAERCGVQGLVVFKHEDARNADLRRATVVVMCLDESLNREIAAKFGSLRSGARVVCHLHGIPGLPAERTVKRGGADIFLWNVPLATARLSGPRHPGPHGSCAMCLGNHLIGNHKIPRSRLDAVGYKRWSTLHDNAHNKGGQLACAL